MQYLYYLNLSSKQRCFSIVLISIVLSGLFYVKRYQESIFQIMNAQASLRLIKAEYVKQQRVIQEKSLMQEKVDLWRKQNKKNDALLELTHDLAIHDAQFVLTDPRHGALVMQSTWAQLLDFFQHVMVIQTPWKISSFSIVRAENTHQILVKMDLEEQVFQVDAVSSPSTDAQTTLGNDPFSTVPSATFENISLYETKWVGVLEKDEKTFAFLMLPNAQIVGLQVGETFGKSTWKIISIQPTKITLQDGAETVIKQF